MFLKQVLILIFLIYFLNFSIALDKSLCKCRILPELKITNGKLSHHNSYPWITSLGNENNNGIPDHMRKYLRIEDKIRYHFCGGSIINEKWILTAAHCLDNDFLRITVGFGNDNDLGKIFDAKRLDVKNIYVHPDYVNKEKIINDIGLIELVEPIKFGNFVYPACLETEQKEIYPGFLNHAGWGTNKRFYINKRTKQSSGVENQQKLLEIDLIDESDSSKKCSENDKIICARGLENGQSSCSGDSGGPIHFTKNGKTSVIGIASYSDDTEVIDNLYYFCNNLTYYTKVSKYMDWIKSYIGNEFCTI